jgi:biotin carboxylase
VSTEETVLFVGAGRHQRRALQRVKELGVRLVAVDRNPEAPGLEIADVGEVVDFADVAAVADVGRRHGVDGVMTFAADRAVPVVAGVAEALGLPGIGTETAHLMTNKIAMRRRLADVGVPQPRFAAIRHVREVGAAAEAVGFPAVLKPADSAGQRGLFLVASADDVERHLHAALAQSIEEEAILESYHAGLEVNGLLVAREGEVTVVTLSDRWRAAAAGFGVALAHVYPSTLFGDALAEV